eukprot:scaffold3514_cov132-Isochrysis_galbana.AAC.2
MGEGAPRPVPPHLEQTHTSNGARPGHKPSCASRPCSAPCVLASSPAVGRGAPPARGNPESPRRPPGSPGRIGSQGTPS